MDFRLARLTQPRSERYVTPGGTCVKVRNYNSKPEELTNKSYIDFKFAGVSPYDSLTTGLNSVKNRVENILLDTEGVLSRDVILKEFKKPLHYALASGVVDSSLYGDSPKDKSIKLMWWAFNIEGSVVEHLDKMNEFNPNLMDGIDQHNLNILGLDLPIDSDRGQVGSTLMTLGTDPFLVNLTHIIINPDGTGRYEFRSDRSPYCKFIGYVPVAFGGKPSALLPNADLQSAWRIGHPVWSDPLNREKTK